MANKDSVAAVFKIVKSGHEITYELNRLLKDSGRTEPQFNVLRILRGRRGSPASVEQIQNEMVQKTSNVTRIIDRLMGDGLVDRKECPTNRRKMDITITDRGKEELKKLDRLVLGFHKPFESRLSAAEFKELSRLLTKLMSE